MKNEKDTKLAEIAKDVTSMVQKAGAIVIKTAEEMASATDFLGQIKARQKRIEELRLSFTKPLNEALRNINNEFKKASEPLDKIERQVKMIMTDYHNKEAERIRKEQAKIAEKQRLEFEAEQERKRQEIADSNLTKKAQKEAIKEIKQEEFVATPTVVQEKTVASDQGKVTFKSVWKYEVIDEQQIPREYLKVDEVALNKAVKLGVREIKGVKIYESKEVSATSR